MRYELTAKSYGNKIITQSFENVNNEDELEIKKQRFLDAFKEANYVIVKEVR